MDQPLTLLLSHATEFPSWVKEDSHYIQRAMDIPCLIKHNHDHGDFPTT